MPTDNICRTCLFFEPEDTPGSDVGQCRRNPPKDNSIYSSWPRVFDTDWCGEYYWAEDSSLFGKKHRERN